MCVSLFYVIDTGSIRVPDPPPRHGDGLGVTYLPSAFQVSSDAAHSKAICRSTPSLVGSPSRHRGSGKNLGHGLWFGAHQREVSDVSMILNSPWTEGSERSDGCAWACRATDTSYASCQRHVMHLLRWCDQNLDGVKQIFKSVNNILMV